MDTTSSWEAQTLHLIERISHEIEALEIEIAKRKTSLQDKKKALEYALETYREMMGQVTSQTLVKLSLEDIKNKSVRQILCLIAERNDGLLIMKDAIRLMKDASVFGNPQNADAAAYSILMRSGDFSKVGKGVYKLNPKPKEHNNKENVSVSIVNRRNSGLRKAIKKLKFDNPQMSKQEVADTLVRQGFNFQGKNVNRAVHMAWISLGYNKQHKPIQQVELNLIPTLFEQKPETIVEQNNGIPDLK